MKDMVATMGILLLLSGSLTACAQEDQTASISPETFPPTPSTYAEGEAKFEQFCATCHGTKATGTNQGPPLVHRIYEPSHHGDAAFQRAVANGVRAHHWHFGNMPAIDGVSSNDVRAITAYVRWLQKQAGIT